MNKKIERAVYKFSKTTDRLLKEYPITCSLEEMRPLFDVGDDVEMAMCYQIQTPEQIAFFKNQGIPITNRAIFFAECYTVN